MEKKYIVVITTTETEEQAKKIAYELVDKHLCACVQISGPIKSIYYWEGKVESSEEWRVMAKTREDLYNKVEECIIKNHPYTVPQIISIPISNGFEKYLRWIHDTVR